MQVPDLVLVNLDASTLHADNLQVLKMPSGRTQEVPAIKWEFKNFKGFTFFRVISIKQEFCSSLYAQNIVEIDSESLLQFVWENFKMGATIV